MIIKNTDMKYSKEIHNDVANINGTDGVRLDAIDTIMIQLTSDRSTLEKDTAENFYSVDDLKDRKNAHYVVGPSGICKYLQSTEVAIGEEESIKGGYQREKTMVVELLWNNINKSEKNLVEFLSNFIFNYNTSTSILKRRSDVIDDGPEDIYLSIYNRKENWINLINSINENVSKLRKIKAENDLIEEYNKDIDLQISKIINKDNSSDQQKKLKEKFKKVISYDIKYKYPYSLYPERKVDWVLEPVSSFKLPKDKEVDANKVHEDEDFREADSLGGLINMFTDEAIGDATRDMDAFEPIYPDLTTPPRGNPTLYTKQIINIDDIAMDKKYTVGDIVNKQEPYPVEQKIAELQAHRPRIKIEEAEAESLGESKQWFMAVTERTEKRMIQLENIVSTFMRNFSRLSSRISINCVYYGGQATYYKYRCIRCLNDNLTADRQLVTMDQCLNCSRYEPIEGQIYDIVDDDMMLNLATVLDDNQMSRTLMDDFIMNVKTENMKDEMPKASFDLSNVNVPPVKTYEEKDLEEKQKEYEEKYFSMDWRETPLEDNTPDTNKYEYNPAMILEDKYNRLDNPEVHGYDKVQKVIINVPPDTYKTAGGSDPGDYSGGFSSDIRNKIVARAEELYKLCQNGQAQYSQGKRTINGPPITYRDCSSLVNDCYKTAGLPGAGGSTTLAMHQYLNKNPGLVIKDEKDARPGDFILFSAGSGGHVGLYIGDGMMIDASSHNPSNTTKDIKRRPYKQYLSWSGAKPMVGFCRTKELVEADKTTVNHTNFSVGGLKEAVNMFGNRTNAWESALKNMEKYGYKHIILEECKRYNFDPNLLMGLISRESTGNPTTTTPRYKGLCQLEFGPHGTSEESMRANIRGGIEHVIEMKRLVENVLKIDNANLLVALTSYNSGQGNFKKWVKATGKISSINNMDAVNFAKTIAEGYKISNGLAGDLGNHISRSTYAVMILYYAEMIKANKVFE